MLLPGSRTGEVTRLLPLCIEVAHSVAKQNEDLFFVFPTVSHIAHLLRQELKDFALRHAIVEDREEKTNAFAAARAALAASGTVALELALAGVPSVICYRVTRLSAFIARRLVRIKFAALPNLILNREIMPEFLQERAIESHITPALADLLSEGAARKQQLDAFAEVATRLKPEAKNPSVRAAEVVLSLLSDPAAAADRHRGRRGGLREAAARGSTASGPSGESALAQSSNVCCMTCSDPARARRAFSMAARSSSSLKVPLAKTL